MANIHITSALPPSNTAICGHWTRETAQKTTIRAVNPCSPKAEVTGSNPVGCANYFKGLGECDAGPIRA